MHGLEAITRIGQRPVHDGRERIVEIALFQSLAQGNVLDPIVGRENQIIVHGGTKYQESGYLGVRIAGLSMNRNQVSG